MEPTLPNAAVADTPQSQWSRVVGSENQPCRQYGNVSVSGQGLTVIGDVYNNTTLLQAQPKRDDVTKFGLCLGAAPQIDPAYFVGRVAEIDEIARILQPGTVPTKQRRVVLGGMGGIGKTQLVIAYLQRYSQKYHSIFWLNATSQLTLHADLRLVAGRILSALELERLNDEQVLGRVHEWLSIARNTQWLLAFDNYDEPAQFDISKYCPYTAHGSVVITSRLPDYIRLSCDQIRIQPLSDVEESLYILQKRSRRQDMKNDSGARVLAERLGGLPLALATAGTYLSKRASITCQQYLDIYEQRWNVDPRRPIYLQEYQDRTLYTTWDLSYSLLTRDDADAAQLLRLLAYFDNQNIWFELLHAGRTEDGPVWLQRLCSDQIEFESTMSTLAEYCFVEVQTTKRSYSMHNCVHDWTLAVLNQTLDQQLYYFVFDCIAALLEVDVNDHGSLGHLKHTGLVPHAERTRHPRFLRDRALEDAAVHHLIEIEYVGALMKDQGQLAAAGQIFKQTLALYEKLTEPDYDGVLRIVNDLGTIYHGQDKLEEAERMYLRALAGWERTLGPNHGCTLTAVNNLALLYYNQRKLDKAEQISQRVLLGIEKSQVSDYLAAMPGAANILGNLYFIQGKLVEAEHMYLRALENKEKVLEMVDTSTLESMYFLASIYRTQGRLDEAESIYNQLLVVHEITIGDNHVSALQLFNSIGKLYQDQGRLEEAEAMYRRALSGFQRRLGTEHLMTHWVMDNLASLHGQQSELETTTSV